MDTRKIILRETAVVAAGELICTAIMLGVFAALGCFSVGVVLSGLGGCAIMIVNYFFMAVTVSLAADKAQCDQVQQAQKMVQLSSVVRLAVMGAALFVGFRLGANPIALALPLLFVRPVLMLWEFLRKKGD